MKIIVAIKQVPARDSLLKIGASGAWIEDADLACVKVTDVGDKKKSSEGLRG